MGKKIKQEVRAYHWKSFSIYGQALYGAAIDPTETTLDGCYVQRGATIIWDTNVGSEAMEMYVETLTGKTV